MSTLSATGALGKQRIAHYAGSQMLMAHCAMFTDADGTLCRLTDAHGTLCSTHKLCRISWVGTGSKQMKMEVPWGAS